METQDLGTSLAVKGSRPRTSNAGDAEDTGLIPGSRRSPRVENGNPVQYSYLENSMDREV